MAAPQRPAERTALANAAKQEARFGTSFLRTHGWRLLLLFAGILLPLWGFAELADEVREAEAFPFDAPLLQLARAMAREGFDQLFLLFSAIGYEYGVVPFDIALVIALGWKRRFRESIFAAAALGGSALLNIAAKQFFARERPSLWESISPEDTFSFPSGHAMGSMTLAVVVVLLAWPTRWRRIALVAMAVFVPMVGLSRIYLGVHYPSDILAGWAAATVWAVGCYGLVFRGHLRPWRLAGERA
jgi:membrane-associated phospholipid phosphatase